MREEDRRRRAADAVSPFSLSFLFLSNFLTFPPRPWLRSMFLTCVLNTTRSRPLWNAYRPVAAGLSGLISSPLPSGKNVRETTVGESERGRERLPARGKRAKGFLKHGSCNHVGSLSYVLHSSPHFYQQLAGRSSFEFRALGSHLVAIRSHERKAFCFSLAMVASFSL